ncbi:MAG: NAD(P)H-dependent oxidoreductase [Bacteroidia bacterium]|nr:NAD(P)H-dependent oxidoreductase [Bacteroidia bacterium]
MKLLHVNAAPRKELSRTLRVSSAYLDSLQSQHPTMEVKHLNLFEMNLPEITGMDANSLLSVVQGGQLSEEAQKSREASLALAHEFLDYDLILVSSPMWNFSIPYKLKQYIDLIMQPGILFTYTEKGPQGLATGKKMIIITSRGSDYSPGGQMADYDFQAPYLRAIFGLAGIYDITFAHAQPMDWGPEMMENAIKKAIQDLSVISIA